MDKLISAFITLNGVPQINLTPSPIVTIYDALTNNILISNQPMIEIGGGFYKYTVTDYDESIEYLFLADAGASFPEQERYYYGTLAQIDNIDANRLSSNIWNYPSNTLFQPNTFGELIQNLDSSVSISVDVLSLLLKYQTNRTKINSSDKTLTIYDNDQVTPIKIFKLYDEQGVLSIDPVFERIPQ